MPSIKPITDLNNYNEVLRDVTVQGPVFLTKDGRGRYALLDIEDYERLQANISLFSVLLKGERSAKESGWLSLDEVESSLGIV